MEKFTKLLFKTVTIIVSVLTIYGSLEWLFPSKEFYDGLIYIYLAFGAGVGIAIAFYITEYFAIDKDIGSIIRVVIIISLTTYTPLAFSAHTYFVNRAIKEAQISPFDPIRYQEITKELEKLEKQREAYLQEPILKRDTFKNQKDSFVSNRVGELLRLKFVTDKNGSIIEPRKRAWGTTKYKRYQKLISEYDSPEELAVDEYNSKLNELTKEIQNRKSSTLYLSEIKRAKEKRKESSLDTFNTKKADAVSNIPPIWVFAILLFVAGIGIELLSVVDVLLYLRKNRVQKQKSKKRIVVVDPSSLKVANIPTVSPKQLPNIAETPKDIKSENSECVGEISPKQQNQKELTLEALLEARYKGVDIGQYLLPKKMLPFEDNDKLKKMLSELNKELKEGGYITGSTRHKALKSYEDAKKYIRRIA